MVEAKSNYSHPFKTTFTNPSDKNIAMYEHSVDQAGGSKSASENVENAAAKKKSGKILDELQKAVQNEASEANKEFLKLQQATQERATQFYKQEDFLRHLELGKEFDEAPRYNSRRKVSDHLGFEYCVPPKDRTIQAKLKGRYNILVAKEKQLEEEEELVIHEMSGTDAPFRIEDLQYDVPYADNESYEKYYGNVKELRLAEQKYKGQLLNIADSALIIDGNVTFGKTTESEDGRPDFERRLSTNSLGDVDGRIVVDKSTRRKVFSTIAKRIRRKRSFDGGAASNTSDNASDIDKTSLKERRSIKLHSVRRRIKLGKDSFHRLKNY